MEVTTSDHEDTSLLSPSTSFVMDSYLTEPQSCDTQTYHLKVPLCVSEIYRKDFFDYFHTNYYGELEREGLFLVSLRDFPLKTNETETTETDNLSSSLPSSEATDQQNGQIVRALIRTQTNNYDVSETIHETNIQKILQILFDKAQLSTICHYELVHDENAKEKIVEFDRQSDEQHYNKVGVLYQRSNQSSESEIFGNDTMSNEMEDFLQLIADRVSLQGFDKYRGDLDIKTNQHGDYSYFTLFKTYEIMFNIGPIIRSEKLSEQFIQRKSLISNSLICIIFQETDMEFQPDQISSKVTHVYIIVVPINISDQLYYKVKIWRRSDISPVINPPSGIFKGDESFRDYFLTLILNIIDLIYEKPYFRTRFIEQRIRLKNEFLTKLSDMCIPPSAYNLSSSNSSLAHSDQNDSDNSINNNISLDTKISLASTESKRFRHTLSHKLSIHKQHHLGLVSKIFHAFNTVRSRSVPPTLNARESNGILSQSKTGSEFSLLPTQHGDHQQQECLSVESPSLLIGALVTSMPNFVEPMDDKTTSSLLPTNDGIDKHVHDKSYIRNLSIHHITTES